MVRLLSVDNERVMPPVPIGTGEVLRLAAFVLPLCLDTFAMSAAVSLGGLPARRRWRLTAVFVASEAGMPLVGLAIGAPLAAAIGGVADYVAAAVLIGLGGWMLRSDSDDDGEKGRRLADARGIALLGLALSVGLDELTIGFGLGLTRVPVPIAIVAIAVQAFVAAQLGFALGARVGERLREGLEKLAGVALIGLGVLLVVEHLLAA